ncbi:carbamate kinase [Clostridium sp.]|uniref:carbamate kinase n=1 Tax=Clostridium sp. TaxID=1506 RepID=UPI003D6D39F7
MKKKVVIALGGNALGSNLKEQMVAVKSTAKAIVDLIEEGNEVVISHGNGPQVGMINIAMSELHKNNPKYSLCPMSVCVAMSQAYIGYDLQNALREELLNRNINKNVSTIITQVEVDPTDKAFENPTKPIGSFMTREEADLEIKSGKKVIEDAGRGYREVVASPKPVGIIEIETIKSLVDIGQVVIACGGGGIPVIKEGNHLKGVSAVIDKDFASCTLAKELNADCLIILTAVEKVAINFGKPNEKWLHNITVDEISRYAKEGHFAPGSMLPKVEAAIDFASSKEGRYSLITLLEKAKDGIAGTTGTIIK